MFYLELFDKSYGPYGDLIKITSNIIPRPGETVDLPESDGHTRFMVFDVGHKLSKGEFTTIVRAREAARMDRIYVLSENGHIAGPHSIMLGYRGDEGHAPH